MRRLLMALPLLLALLLPHDALAQGEPLLEFFTPPAAQQHCPSETVVWLNTRSGVYHFRGERWYGRTKSGAYVCQREANQAGMRATRNGQ